MARAYRHLAYLPGYHAPRRVHEDRGTVPARLLDTAGLPNYLATLKHADATRPLAKPAIFSPNDKVRAAAIEKLKPRASKDYADVLMQGFRYPLPVVSERAAEALVALKCADALPGLVKELERPDPRAPQKFPGLDVSVVGNWSA
jgi:hypothetical protein